MSRDSKTQFHFLKQSKLEIEKKKIVKTGICTISNKTQKTESAVKQWTVTILIGRTWTECVTRGERTREPDYNRVQNTEGRERLLPKKIVCEKEREGVKM